MGFLRLVGGFAVVLLSLLGGRPLYPLSRLLLSCTCPILAAVCPAPALPPVVGRLVLVDHVSQVVLVG